MARFRPFGRRQDGPAAHEPDPWLDDPPPGGGRDLGPGVDVRSVDDPRFADREFDDRGWDDRDLDNARLDDRDRWGPGPVAGVAATRAAAPALWAPRRADPDPVELDDAPVTDPFGFPPVPPVVGTDDDPPVRRAPAWAAWVPDRPSQPDPLPAEADEPAEGTLRPSGGPVHARSWVADGSPAAGGGSAAATARAVPAQDTPSSAAPITSRTAYPAAHPVADPSGAGPSSAQPRPATPTSAVASSAEPASAAPKPDAPSPATPTPATPVPAASPSAEPTPAASPSAASPSAASPSAASPSAASPSAASPTAASPTAEPTPAAPTPGVPASAPHGSTAAPLSLTAVARPPGPPDRLGEPPTPDPAEAAALAGAFAADYLSWDEDDPARRGRALADHLPGPDAGHALLGWSGGGRQRAEIVLPGAVRPDGDGRLLVDVRVRVTPYRRVSRSEATPEPDPGDALGTPAAAPPVTARGWRGLAARWVRLGVAVIRDGERLVVDVGEETSDDPDGEPDPAPARPVRTPEDPTIDGDDVVAVNGSRR